MEQINPHQSISQIRLTRSSRDLSQPASTPIGLPTDGDPAPRCPICGNVGWYYKLGAGDPVLTRCRCGAGVDNARRIAYLQKIDGLRDNERAYTFTAMRIDPDNQAAVLAVAAATAAGRGMITLTGAPGRGKTFLLMAAVNEARARNVPAVYTTITDLLDYLRAAFNPNADGETFDRRWDLLVTCEVLAIDEIDEFNATPWAMERFLRLIDERWRALDCRLTLFATNAALDDLPAKVASRIGDKRAQTLTVGGVDRRKGGAK